MSRDTARVHPHKAGVLPMRGFGDHVKTCFVWRSSCSITRVMKWSAVVPDFPSGGTHFGIFPAGRKAAVKVADRFWEDPCHDESPKEKGDTRLRVGPPGRRRPRARVSWPPRSTSSSTGDYKGTLRTSYSNAPPLPLPQGDHQFGFAELPPYRVSTGRVYRFPGRHGARLERDLRAAPVR